MLIRSFLVFSVLAFGQLNQASLLGVVEDSSGAVVAGAAVQVRNRATSQTWDLTTDNSGLFIAPVLPIGFYSAAVSHCLRSRTNRGASASSRTSSGATD